MHCLARPVDLNVVLCVARCEGAGRARAASVLFSQRPWFPTLGVGHELDAGDGVGAGQEVGPQGRAMAPADYAELPSSLVHGFGAGQEVGASHEASAACWVGQFYGLGAERWSVCRTSELARRRCSHRLVAA